MCRKRDGGGGGNERTYLIPIDCLCNNKKAKRFQVFQWKLFSLFACDPLSLVSFWFMWSPLFCGFGFPSKLTQSPLKAGRGSEWDDVLDFPVVVIWL